MGMTMVEKILAAHCDSDQVKAGELINVRLDGTLANDVTAPVAIREFNKLGVKTVFDRNKVFLVPDHFAPNKDIMSAEQTKIMRDFAREHEIVNYFEIGEMGVEHCLLPEKGLVLPGDVVIGADSHTCTYGALGAFATGVGSTDMACGMATGEAWFKVPETIKFVFKGELQPYVTGKDLILHTIGDIGVDGARYCAMEFTGPVIEQLTMDQRFTMANMAIEAGAKCGLFEVDDKTLAYVKDRAKREFTIYKADEDAVYSKVIEYDVSTIEPTVAFPHLPENTHPVSHGKDIAVDQVVIGSCTNGRLEDLRVAARLLEGQKVNRNVRTIVIPGTQQIYLDAMKEGLVEIFINAGAIVSTPTCGPCLGGHMGILAKGERAVATTNRNFVGRMGHPESEVYLASPAVAAATAIVGKITHPADIKPYEEVVR